jgi:hypothetical protein
MKTLWTHGFLTENRTRNSQVHSRAANKLTGKFSSVLSGVKFDATVIICFEFETVGNGKSWPV